MADSVAQAKAIETIAEIAQPVNDEAQHESPEDRLADLTARATALYAVKKYEEAAELYSEATEVQAEVNGEMDEKNADLLFAYGRCLFYVAQKTSTVLGGTAASAQLKGNEKKPSKKRRANGTIKAESSASAAAPSTTLQPVTETAEPADVVPAVDVQPDGSSKSDKPFFQIEGDAADWDDSDEEADGDDGVEGEADEEEEEDDFNTAFEILDMSRILYTRKLEALPASNADATTTRHLRTRVSDIYDLQAEISLEGEKFDAAVIDLRSCLELKQQLYTPDNALVAECHYKLSLALEAASQVQQRDNDGNPVGEIEIDWPLRNEAVENQAKAMESCRLRVAKETKEMEELSADKKQKAKEQIEDVKDMIQAMEQRLDELKKPPVSVKAEAEKDAAQELMGSVLGSMLGVGAGTSKGDQKEKLAEIMAGANDLSGAVKRKKPKTTNGNAEAPIPEKKSEAGVKVNGNGKRKIDETREDIKEVQTEVLDEMAAPSKKVRIEDVID